METAAHSSELRRLERRLLPLGEPLPGCLYDHDGRVLVRAGLTLDETQFENLIRVARRGVYVDPNWPGPAQADEETTPIAILQAIKEQLDHGDSDTRRHERRQCRIPVTVDLSERGVRGGVTRSMTVAAVNISTAGLAFELNSYVHPGTELCAHFEHLPCRPRIRAIVRNCIHLSGRVHRVGVEFLQTAGRNPHAGDSQQPT